MHLFALSQEVSDSLALWGFVVGILGLVIGVLGFGYTIYQVHKVETAALAAERAAAATLIESRKSFRRFLAASAHRILAEVRVSVDGESWQIASLRANDLADLLGQFPELVNEAVGMANRLREFGQVFAAKQRDPAKRHAPRKWDVLLRQLHQFIDRAQAPFRDVSESET